MRRLICILFAVLISLIIFPAAQGRYVMCENMSSSNALSPATDGFYQNGTDSFMQYDSSARKLWHLDSQFKRQGNLTLNVPSNSVSVDIAMNRSNTANQTLYSLDTQYVVVLRLNNTGAGNKNWSLPSDITAGLEGFDTLDGNTWYIFDTGNFSITSTNDNFTQIDRCQINGTSTDAYQGFALWITNNTFSGFIIEDNTKRSFLILNKQCGVIDRIPVLDDISGINTIGKNLQNSTTWWTRDTAPFAWNISDDIVMPSVVGPRLNQTRFISGDSVDVNVTITDNCVGGRINLISNETGVTRNLTGTSQFLIMKNVTRQNQEYGISYNNVSICSKDLGLGLFVSDTAGNSNITPLNTTTAYPLMANFQKNSTEPWNCTAVSSTNFTYTFGLGSWFNFSINLSQNLVQGNLTCPYFADGSEITNITNQTNGCKVGVINRIPPPSNVVTISRYVGVSTTNPSNLPVAIVASSLAAIVIGVFIARSRRNV